MEKEITKYNKIEKEFFLSAKKAFGKSLVLYCVTGGLGRKEIIKDWSDIDILLVFKTEFDHKFWKVLQKITSKKYPIKIGCTFYTLDEFKNTPYKDTKTLLSIILMKAGVYSPRIISKQLNLNKLDISLRPSFDLADFADGLHELKRELLLYPELNEKKIVKVIYKMMKIILRRAGFESYGYKDTANNFARAFPDFKAIISPETVVNDLMPFKERYESYIKFLQYIKKTGYARV